MKFLFIQKSAFPLPGVMSLAAVIKKNGWEVELLLERECNLFQEVKRISPDIIGFSVFTGEHQWILQTAAKLKKQNPKSFVVLGGPHPTYYPEIIYEKGVDAIVRGEGEGAVADLVQALGKRKPLVKIPNLWVKRDQRIHKTSLRPLIGNLNQLPLPDRQIYYKYDFLKKASVKQFLTGRGCPYNCSFCSNHLLRKLYAGKGKFLRRSSPGRMLREIKEVQQKYGFQTISFTDDVFISDKLWLKKFLPLYKKEIGVPFMCNVTANSLDEELARMLKKGGCYGIAMGVESGDEKMRFKVLNKFITDRQILESGRLAKKYKLALKTYNILSLPGETVDGAIKTVKINSAINPLSATASLLQPFPKYEITEYALRHRLLPPKFGVTNVSESIYLSSPVLGQEAVEIENLQAFFPFLVAHPNFIPVVKLIIKWRCRPFFRLVARLTYGYYMSRVHRLSLRDKIRYLRHIDPLKV